VRLVTVDEVTRITDRIIQEDKDRAKAAGKPFVIINYAEVARRVNEELGEGWELDIPPCPMCGGVGEPLVLGSDKKYRCKICHYDYDDEVRV